MPSEIPKKVSALAVGAANLPLDIAKYAGMGWNYASNLPKKEITRRNNELADFFDNAKFLPEGVQNYRNWVIKENPELVTTGEIGLATTLAAPLSGLRVPVSLVKGAKPAVFTDRLLKYSKKAIPAAAAATTVKAGEELLVEPFLDKGLADKDSNITKAVDDLITVRK